MALKPKTLVAEPKEILPPPEPEVKAGPALCLDLGCGDNRMAGWVGYDIRGQDTRKVDVVHDLEKTPWPGKEGTHVPLVPWDGLVWMWPESSVDEARFHRSLEYMCATPAALRAVFAELHRVLKPGGLVFIDFLNPKNVAYFDDPDAVRPVTAALLYRIGGFEIESGAGVISAHEVEPEVDSIVLRAVK